MPNVLIVLAGVLVLAGLGGIAAGAPTWVLGVGLGSNLIQSGTISLVGGLVLFGLALVLRELQELTRRIAMLTAMSGGRAHTAAQPPGQMALPPPLPAPGIHEGRLPPEPEYPPLRRERGRIRADRDEMADPFMSGMTSRSRAGEPSFVTEKNPSGAAVVRSGIVGGMGYTLYADGSIEAELPMGTVRFNSLAELQEHVTRTGEEDDTEFSGRTQ
jgi:hypothetical protein